MVVPSERQVMGQVAQRLSELLADVDGVPCVHPVQVYLDLKGHPERSSEAAARLRAEALPWTRHARQTP